MVTIETTAESVAALYETLAGKHGEVRDRLGRPLTLTEKIVLAHLDDPAAQELERGRSTLFLRPDRVALQDATAQMALLQFTQADIPARTPATVHCDHLIRARSGAAEDMENALGEHREVYDFLESACRKYGLGFWKPGAGIIHQVVLENYAFPGGLMIGTDSHTPNAGGIGMIACGVGGADAADVLAGLPWEVLYPKMIGVRLTGQLSGWTAPKDLILKICKILTTRGGANHVVEYFGPGVESISATGRATITNMGAEIGATTSLFPFDGRTAAYLRATEREAIATLAEQHAEQLVADPEVGSDPERFFDRVIEIDLSKLEPHVVGPHTPDAARPLSRLAAEARKKGWPGEIKVALVGSCTNSSYEDIGRAAAVARQALEGGLTVKSRFMVTPGSERIHETIKRDGLMETLEAVGATVLANACGPCIGMWERSDVEPGTPNTIVTSFNRNFPGRNDGSANTLAFIASPEVVMALALAGSLDFNPLADTLHAPDGAEVRLDPPVAPELPERGFEDGRSGYAAPAEDGSSVELAVDPESERLQLLAPFEPWNGNNFDDLPVLVKARGKCTTDQISPAGVWLRFRGHLDRISDNMFLGAINAFTGEAGKGMDQLSGEKGLAFAAIARRYKAGGLRWVAVGDENYGEGSSREHAAMSPRFLGAAAVIARSFARIHETNLKKQGVLPLTFTNRGDYKRVGENDRISVKGLADLAPGRPLVIVIRRPGGMSETMAVRHSLTAEQVEWFKAGSALNLLKQKMKGGLPE